LVTWPIHFIFIVFLFALGTVVGSFLNVCIYRIPWQKSVIWPGSRCPKCWNAIAPQDNIPIVSWLALRGHCRHCSASIAARYPLVEALVGLLFVGVYVTDVLYGPPIPWGTLPARYPLQVAYHLALVALLVAATFIDYDLWIIPDEITVTGMIVGLGLGTIFPEIRPDPSMARTHAEGFWVGLTGLLVGGGLTLAVRQLGSLAFRKEAMGLGDVTLMAMIGAFLGWQIAVMTFFLGAFVGLGHALWKVVKLVGKRLAGRKIASVDHELPYGPYLSMAAAMLMLSWPWLWKSWAHAYFDQLRMVFWFLLGYPEVGGPPR
jgi:leader peptidase (prepilin peptidase)/N-methyltransferase